MVEEKVTQKYNFKLSQIVSFQCHSLCHTRLIKKIVEVGLQDFRESKVCAEEKTPTDAQCAFVHILFCCCCLWEWKPQYTARKFFWEEQVYFKKLLSSIAVQQMQWIQMIHNSHIFNMLIVKNSHLLITINWMWTESKMHLIMYNKWQTWYAYDTVWRHCGNCLWLKYILYISAKCTNNANHISVKANVFLLHSYLALCQQSGSSQFSMHRNRTNIHLLYNKGGHLMVHLIYHITVFLCTIQTIVY